MSAGKNLVGEKYRDLYAGYYSHATETLLKREISALQTVDCMTAVFRGRVFHKLLDVGAGNGNVLSQLQARALARELYGVEISESGVEAIKAKRLQSLCDVQLFDGYTIPHPDKYF